MVCRLLYVKDLEFIDATATGEGAAAAAAPPRPPPGQTELPTCPVCLERLDEHISGVVTTVSCAAVLYGIWERNSHVSSHLGLIDGRRAPDPVDLLSWGVLIRNLMVGLSLRAQVCNHRFHNECLQRWGDTSCPVCRYCADASTADSRCSICGTAQVLQPCILSWSLDRTMNFMAGASLTDECSGYRIFSGCLHNNFGWLTCHESASRMNAWRSKHHNIHGDWPWGLIVAPMIMQDLWMCLICGHVGCGRYRAGHAAAHSQASGHAYALELEAQRTDPITPFLCNNMNYNSLFINNFKNEGIYYK